MRRSQPASLAVALTGVVLGLDLAWGLLGVSSGSLAFGLVDEPAHLATAALVLLALSAAGGRLPSAFVGAALLASVAIDLDHLPGYLGWDVIAGSASRPYSHGFVAVLAVFGLSFLARGRYRLILLGVSFGIAAHLLRDSATGPGIAPAWPLEEGVLSIPYAAYVAVLALALLAVFVRKPAREGGRGGRVTPTPTPTSAALAAVVAVALGLLCSPAEGDAAKRPHSSAKVGVGVYAPGFEQDPAALDAYVNAAGRAPTIIHLYRTWAQQPFESGALDAVRAWGAMPLVTWEPWGEFEGAGISLWDIASGARDAYIAEAARQAAAWGAPLFVRFAHEMNGSWYPWGAWVNGNTPVAFKAAWRRIVSIFRAEGATNVRWVWCPYVHLAKLPFRRYYPGDKWVDWAGFDGFNWGNPFTSFRTIFDKSYREMVRLTSKPLMIAETGSIEAGGSKATWIRRAMKRALPRYTHVRALVWFSDVHPNGADWRIDTSPSALRALGAALRAPRYRQRREFLLARPSWLRRR
jgi:membrane-bound metal-dependent hydrolase YbcI (DUF457 family)